jgi:hypothetical protein
VVFGKRGQRNPIQVIIWKYSKKKEKEKEKEEEDEDVVVDSKEEGKEEEERDEREEREEEKDKLLLRETISLLNCLGFCFGKPIRKVEVKQ